MDPRDQQRVEALLDALGGFGEAAGNLADADWSRPTGCPGWDVRAIVSHVVGVETVLTGGPEPDVEVPPGLTHVRDEIGAYMERHVLARRDVPAADLLAELASAFDARRRQLEGDLTAPTPTGLGHTVPLVRALGLRTFDIWAHEQDIRRALRWPTRLDGPAATVSAKRMIRGLEATLPRRVGPADATVVLAVTGAQPAQLVLDLSDGTALEAVPDTPDLRVTIDFADLVPLACGRDDAPDPGRVATVAGDDGLAAQVLTSLAITP